MFVQLMIFWFVTCQSVHFWTYADVVCFRSLKNNSVKATDAFELRIDAVTNIPDSASIIKVSCQYCFEFES